ncbi:MAG: hypothetical protein NTV80_20655, partial [Verrucomicrobia bacterium]|nr:hypothetical protein [Verrucomicrobiota bacterium]
MKLSPIWIIAVLCAASSLGWAEPKQVRVFVALADNASQGIAPVPAKIGNGDDAEANLYWGNSEGFKGIFTRSKSWKLERSEPDPTPQILDRRTYRHTNKDCILIAEAWRGKNIQQCLEACFKALHDDQNDLVAFIGHNGLMEARIPADARPPSPTPPDAIILCCISGRYFQHHLEVAKARPILTTTQLMYPGSFLLRDALEVWLRGGSRSEIRQAAAQAYAKNQSISVKAAS